MEGGGEIQEVSTSTSVHVHVSEVDLVTEKRQGGGRPPRRRREERAGRPCPAFAKIEHRDHAKKQARRHVFSCQMPDVLIAASL